MFIYLLDLIIIIKINNSWWFFLVINFIFFVFLGRYGIKEFVLLDFVFFFESLIEK